MSEDPPKVSSYQQFPKSEDTGSVPRRDDAVYKDIFLGFSGKNVLISTLSKSEDTGSVPRKDNAVYKDIFLGFSAKNVLISAVPKI